MGKSSKDLDELDILIGEIEAVNKGLMFNIAGYYQKLPDGTEYFACKMCGNTPYLLLERLKRVRDSSRPPKKGL